ncbi:MAG: PhnE/PtxC family ABC transporter permease [Planctomycetota bacterium]
MTTTTTATIGELRRTRPRSRFARISVLAMAVLVGYSWLAGDLELGRLLSARSAANLERFLGEIRPHPLWGQPWDWDVAGRWLVTTLKGTGGEAVLSTVALSVAAICLAALLALFLCLAAARNVATAEPFLPATRPPSRWHRFGWRAVVIVTRAFLIFARAIPEYIWAFLLLTMFGFGAWPAVLALALHNAGILGKLNAEVVENLEPNTLRALRGVGASRSQIAITAILPAALGRFLLYFFYRWETCVREATVLGLLGFVSLGWYIQQARAGVRYDEMVLFVLLGAGIILVGDFTSAVARALVRRAGSRSVL